jgi:hypothetical protein
MEALQEKSETLQILVHQISSSDLVLLSPDAACAKPHYSKYIEVSDFLLSRTSTPVAGGTTLLTSTVAGQTRPVPLGVQFITPASVARSSLTLRDAHGVLESDSVSITGILLPVIAALIPRWEEEVHARTPSGAETGIRKIVYLISGPHAHAGPESEAVGSTDGIAMLLARFLRAAYPDITTCIMCGELGTDRYDAQVQFIKHALSPHIDGLRARLVARHAENWATYFSLAISMAAGSPARLAAINASLRQYKPSYLHCPLVKAFYHDCNFTAQLQSIQYITFEGVEGTPPVPVAEVDEECRALVAELRKYADRFLRCVHWQGRKPEPEAAGYNSASRATSSEQNPASLLSAGVKRARSEESDAPASATGSDALPLAVSAAASHYSHAGAAGPTQAGNGVHDALLLQVPQPSTVQAAAGDFLTGQPVPPVVVSHFPPPAAVLRQFSSCTSSATGDTHSTSSGSSSLIVPVAHTTSGSGDGTTGTGLTAKSHYLDLHAADSVPVGGEQQDADGNAASELMEFWLRKTRKPVLAVVLVRRSPRHPRRYFSAQNLEVSMPTGSLCSERAAIAMALAADPGLRRSDIRMVAVLSLPKLDHPDPQVRSAYQAAGFVTETYRAGILPPPLPAILPGHGDSRTAAISNSLLDLDSGTLRTPKLAKAGHPIAEPDAPQHLRKDESVTKSSDAADTLAQHAIGGTPLLQKQQHQRSSIGGLLVVAPGAGSPKFVRPSDTEARSHMHVTPQSAVAALLLTSASGPAAPLSALTAHHEGDPESKSGSAAAMPNPAVVGESMSSGSEAFLPSRTSHVPAVTAASSAHLPHVPVALNPIAPCGSCMEWLRKIAEVNPDFKILTFTDISCTKVFIREVPTS